MLPFQESILEHWSVRASEAGKKEIIKKITDYNNAKVTNTNIVEPIREVQTRYIKNDKRNMFFLLTDGKQTGGNKELLGVIREWAEYAKINDAHAVYVMLTKHAIDEEITSEVDNTEHIEIITEPGKIDWLDLQVVSTVRYNIKDEQGTPVRFALTSRKNMEIPENIQVRVKSRNNPYITINETVTIQNGEIAFPLNYNYQTLKTEVPELATIPVEIVLLNQDEVKKNSGKIIILSPKNVEIELINKPEKTLRIHVKKNN